MAKSRFALIACALLLLSGEAVAAGPVGTYRLTGEHEVASGLRLGEDGRFQYFLSVGALDEQSEGRWTLDGKVLHLTTEPKPVPPAFSVSASALSPQSPFTLKVSWPDGRGIAGVDFRLGFDSGEPITDYTQEDGWTMPQGESRIPSWIELAVPMHDLEPQRFPIDGAKANQLVFTLTPNDLGKIDLGPMRAEFDGANILIYRSGHALTYVPEQSEQ